MASSSVQARGLHLRTSILGSEVVSAGNVIGSYELNLYLGLEPVANSIQISSFESLVIALNMMIQDAAKALGTTISLQSLSVGKPGSTTDAAAPYPSATESASFAGSTGMVTYSGSATSPSAIGTLGTAVATSSAASTSSKASESDPGASSASTVPEPYRTLSSATADLTVALPGAMSTATADPTPTAAPSGSAANGSDVPHQSTSAHSIASEPSIDSTYTTVVTGYTTYCPKPTVFTENGKTYTITGATTVTITDCPCTLTKTGTLTSPHEPAKSHGQLSQPETDESVAHTIEAPRSSRLQVPATPALSSSWINGKTRLP